MKVDDGSDDEDEEMDLRPNDDGDTKWIIFML